MEVGKIFITFGKTVNHDSVINQGAGTHDDGCWREDFELQPGRREGLQVARLGEERKTSLRGRGTHVSDWKVNSFMGVCTLKAGY